MGSHIFGPVPSRRLGRSLGVDLVPFKTCTYDCIYCQLGRTTNKTMERKEWVPLRDVLGELRQKLCSKPDYITLSGSGEPTLFSRVDGMWKNSRQKTNSKNRSWMKCATSVPPADLLPEYFAPGRPGDGPKSYRR